MMNHKMLSILWALPLTLSVAGNTFARDSGVKPPDFEGLAANPQTTLRRSNSVTDLSLLAAARGEQPGKCELLGICK